MDEKHHLENAKAASDFLKDIGRGSRTKCPMTGDSLVYVRPEKSDEHAGKLDKAIEHFESAPRETPDETQD